MKAGIQGSPFPLVQADGRNLIRRGFPELSITLFYYIHCLTLLLMLYHCLFWPGDSFTHMVEVGEQYTANCHSLTLMPGRKEVETHNWTNLWTSGPSWYPEFIEKTWIITHTFPLIPKRDKWTVFHFSADICGVCLEEKLAFMLGGLERKGTGRENVTCEVHWVPIWQFPRQKINGCFRWLLFL